MGQNGPGGTGVDTTDKPWEYFFSEVDCSPAVGHAGSRTECDHSSISANTLCHIAKATTLYSLTGRAVTDTRTPTDLPSFVPGTSACGTGTIGKAAANVADNAAGTPTGIAAATQCFPIVTQARLKRLEDKIKSWLPTVYAVPLSLAISQLSRPSAG